MKQTRLALAAGLLAASVAAAPLAAFAQAPAAPAQPRTPPAPRVSPEDAAAYADARIAALKAGLRLNAEQEKLWPAFEAALRDLNRARADRAAAFRAEWTSRLQTPADQRPAVDPLSRLRQSAAMATQRAAELTKLADAAEPLVKTLDDSQKRRFNALLRVRGEGQGWRARR